MRLSNRERYQAILETLSVDELGILYDRTLIKYPSLAQIIAQKIEHETHKTREQLQVLHRPKRCFLR